MNRRRGDAVVGLLAGAVLVLGGTLTWQASRQRRTMDGAMESMMGSSIGTVHGPDPVWYGLGTVFVAAAIVGLYAVVRDDLAASGSRPPSVGEGGTDPAAGEPPATTSEPNGGVEPEAQPRARVLDLLPEDERRVLEPVLESPGITQIALRDRSDFSKSKVSQTVSALEKRGLLFRERQGRTYRIYPSDELQQDQH